VKPDKPLTGLTNKEIVEFEIRFLNGNFILKLLGLVAFILK
jgi:hypothetical protein